MRTGIRSARRAVWLLLAAALALVGLVLTPGPALAATASWPQFGHDPQHTGFNPDEAVITRSTVGNLNLDYVTFGPQDPTFGGISQSSPAVVGRVAYIGVDSGFLLALPATGCGSDTCTPLWTARLSNGVFTTPAVAGGLVFIASAGSVENGLGTLYAFPAAGCGRPTCRPVWTAPVPGASSPTVANGILYIVAGDGRLLAFTAAGCGQATCAPLWTGPMKTSSRGAPAVGNGLVYATSSDRLIAFRAAGCGQPVCGAVWASISVDPTGDGASLIQDAGPTVSGDKVYFPSVNFSDPDGKDGTVWAYPAAGCPATTPLNCTPLWVAHPADFDSINATLTVANGVLYGSAVGFLFAFDANGCGDPVCGFLWFGVLPGTIAGTGASPSVAGGVVYYTQNNGQIGGFDARGCGEILCTPLWSTLTQPFEAFMTTPVIVNGRLYVAGPAVGAQPTMWVYQPVTT
jgi:hypothetical protein